MSFETLTSVGRRLNWCGRQYHVMRYGECYVALWSQRTNHVLHYEYTSTGENLPFLEEEYEIATENGVFQMNGRWSDNPIVLWKTWCTFCPMGTMTQGICKLKNNENK